MMTAGSIAMNIDAVLIVVNADSGRHRHSLRYEVKGIANHQAPDQVRTGIWAKMSLIMGCYAIGPVEIVP